MTFMPHSEVEHTFFRAFSSGVERALSMREAEGSIPSSSIFFFNFPPPVFFLSFCRYKEQHENSKNCIKERRALLHNDRNVLYFQAAGAPLKLEHQFSSRVRFMSLGVSLPIFTRHRKKMNDSTTTRSGLNFLRRLFSST